MADWLVRQLAAPRCWRSTRPWGTVGSAPCCSTPPSSPACRSRPRRASSAPWTCWPSRWPASPSAPAPGAPRMRVPLRRGVPARVGGVLARGGGGRAGGGGRLRLPAARPHHAGPPDHRGGVALRDAAPRPCGPRRGGRRARGPGPAHGRGPRRRRHLVGPGRRAVRRDGPVRRRVPAARPGLGHPLRPGPERPHRRPPGPRPGESPARPAPGATEWERAAAGWATMAPALGDPSVNHFVAEGRRRPGSRPASPARWP